MKFQLTTAQENGKNLASEKEIIEMRNLIAFDGEKFNELIWVRWYTARIRQAEKVHCSIWINTKVFGRYTSGYGTASGIGTCKLSTAFAEALKCAGIYASEPISGRGMSIVDECLKEMGLDAGFYDVYIAKMNLN